MHSLSTFLLTGLLAVGTAVAQTPAPAGQPTVVARQPLLGGLWHAYAPSVLHYRGKNIMLLGGWALEEHEGDDLIYYSEQQQDGYWSKPVVAFEKKGYAVNDPTIIRHPKQPTWLFMYYTALAKADQTAENMVKKNVIGFASSVDGGKSWTDHGIIIGQDNGVNSHGGWAPSVVLAPRASEFWIYYHTNSPSNVLLRTRVDLNGWRIKDKPRQVEFLGTPIQNGRVNVDVVYDRGNKTFHMVTNDFSLNKIGYYQSQTGVRFYPRQNTANPIIDGGPNQVLTPNLMVRSAYDMDVIFGFAQNDNPCSREWQANGHPTMQCSDGIHKWVLKFPPLLRQNIRPTSTGATMSISN